MAPFSANNLEALKDQVGKELGVSEWFTITQARIQQFAEATEDRQWIHLDRERAAKESPYGDTIAHGFLTLSLVSHFLKELVPIESGVRLAVNYGLNRVRFPAPVKVDMRIRARAVLLGLKDVQGGAEATYSMAIEGEGSEKPCCIAEWIVRYYS
jgi:acyl dehydratase